MMFLLFAPVGVFWPLFPLHLKKLGFTPLEIALATISQAVAMLLAPILAGQVADRWLSADRCLALCSFAVAGLLWLLADCTTPLSVFLVMFAYWVLMIPIMTLGNTICFAHLHSPERSFGGIRMWGTVGWVLVGWLVGYLLNQPGWFVSLLREIRPDMPHVVIADALRLGTLLAMLLGCYALTLPNTPPSKKTLDLLAPLAALRLLRRRDFAVYFGCYLVLCMTLPFSTQNVSLFLDELGISDRWKGPAMTIAQSTEVLTLFLLPWLLSRFGQRAIMVLGAAAWAGSFAALAIGQPAAFVVSCLSLNGLFITCFVVAGQMFVNRLATADIRASAQSLVNVAAGFGLLLGYALSGGVRHLVGGAFQPTFGVATALASLALLVFAIGFRPLPIENNEVG
jgi:nucleoside transporter